MHEAATISVLAILPSVEDQTSLKEIFQHSRWSLHLVESVGHARNLIDELPTAVVISDSRLPDGCWQDVLLELQCRRVEPALIVASRLADDALWAQLLNLGGYDVLAMPFESREVVRSVSLAWRHWQSQRVTQDQRAGAARS
jgi:DNA-binding NtrC family response regulator